MQMDIEFLRLYFIFSRSFACIMKSKRWKLLFCYDRIEIEILQSKGMIYLIESEMEPTISRSAERFIL